MFVSLKLLCWIQIDSERKLANFSKSFCLLVYLILKESNLFQSFPNSINVLWIQIFNTITDCSLMTLQIWRVVEEIITTGATKGLEYCIDIVRIAYVIVVSKLSHNNFNFLHIHLASSPIVSPLTKSMSYKKNIVFNYLFNYGKVVLKNSLEPVNL